MRWIDKGQLPDLGTAHVGRCSEDDRKILESLSEARPHPWLSARALDWGGAEFDRNIIRSNICQVDLPLGRHD